MHLLKELIDAGAVQEALDRLRAAAEGGHPADSDAALAATAPVFLAFADKVSELLGTPRLDQIESEKRLKEAQRIARLGSWDHDVTAGRLIWSEETFRILGLRVGETTPAWESFLECVYPEDREEVAAQYDDAVRASMSCDMEFRIERRSDKAVRHVHFRCEPALGETGGAVHLIGMVHDVTQQRLAAAALRESERRFRETLESVRLLAIGVDVQGSITFANEFLLESLKWTRDEVLGRDWFDLASPTEPMTRENYTRLTQTGKEELRHFENEIQTADGQRRIVRWNNTALRNSAGKIVGMLSIGEDITEQEWAQRALLASEERLRGVFEQAAVGVCLAALDGRTKRANPAFSRIVGYPEADLLNRHFAEFTHPDDLMTEVLKFRELRSGGTETYTLEKRFVREDGEIVWVTQTVSPLRDAEGRLVEFITVVEDITDRKQAQEELMRAHGELEARVRERTAELEAANERLRELDRLKSEFLSTISHELRTPLSSIIGFTRLMEGGLVGPVTAEQKKYLGVVFTAANHLLSLINDLLDLSRIEAGRVELVVEPFDVMGVVGEASSTVAPLAMQKGLHLHTDLPTPSLEVYGDRKRCLQVVINLLGNAVKFTPKGEVKVAVRRDGLMVRVSVSDTGIGIREEDFSKLFQAFRQLEDSARRSHEGTGLGLHLCQRLARLMNGEIAVQSEYGKGSTFTFSIPLDGRKRPDGDD